MEKLIGDFIDAITRENRILDTLAEYAILKKELIIFNKVEELDSMIRNEGTMISNLDKAEGARFKLQGQLASHWGLSVQDLKASEILNQVGKSYPEVYSRLKEEISRLDYNMLRLKALNAHNNELINQSLDYISVMESVLSGDVAGTYSQKGQQTDESEARPRINILDKKI